MEKKVESKKNNSINSVSRKKLNFSIIVLDIIAFIFIYFLTPKLLNFPVNSMNLKFQKATIGHTFLEIYLAIFTLIVIAMSIKMYFDKVITLGDLTFNINISTSLFMWLKWALESISENIEIYGKMKQAVNTLIVERKILDKENAPKINISSGKIVFNNINFKY